MDFDFSLLMSLAEKDDANTILDTKADIAKI